MNGDTRSMRFIGATAFLFSHICAATTTSPPSFTVDLAVQPQDRWKGALALITAPFAESWEIIFKFHNTSLFDALTADDFSALGDSLSTHFPENALELQGISDEFLTVHQQYVSFDYLAAWVYFHELAHTDIALGSALPGGYFGGRECTGLLAQDAEGNVFHAANMDQSPEEVRSVVLHVTFTNSSSSSSSSGGGDVPDALLEAVDWYWFTTGLSRVVAPGLASMQENWRTTTTTTLDETLYSDIASGVVPQILVFRSVLLPSSQVPAAVLLLPAAQEGTSVLHASSSSSSPPPPPPPTSFEELVQVLSTIRLAAPFYVVAAGAQAGEGVVLARNLTGVDDGGSGSGPLRLNASTWFLVQTNYDHWLPDDPSDPRRTVGEGMLAQFGQNVGASAVGLMMAAGTWPVHNPHTAYTALMNAKTALVVPFVRDAMCPEHPGELPPDSRYCQGVGMRPS